ncbi:MAG TPA: hypothetical protein VF548_01335 [Allosphingosinicella sp.]|jgi:hypothetical protein
MHGIILDLYDGEDPITVSAIGPPSKLRERKTIDPDRAATNWPLAQVQKVERTSKRSTKTPGEMLDGWICKRVGA